MLLKTYLFASTNDGDTIGSMIKRRVKKNWPRWKSGPQPKLTAYEKVKYLYLLIFYFKGRHRNYPIFIYFVKHSPKSALFSDHYKKANHSFGVM